jgi:hypothetical protein
MQDTDCGLYVEWHRDQWHTVPLYRQPALTDAEREAVEFCIACSERDVRSDIVVAARAAVARLGGGR